MADQDVERGGELRAIFTGHGERRRIERGHCLHSAGEPLCYIHLLTTGWIGRVRANLAGETAFTAIHIAGDVVGVDAMENERLDDDIVALSDVAVLRVPVKLLVERVTTDVAAAMQLVRLLAADAFYLREALLAVGRQSSAERLSTFILQTYHRLVSAGLVPAGATQFDFPLTQVQIAGVTGLTSVHVNRVLRQLRETGHLDVRSGVVRLGNLAALERTAEPLGRHRGVMRD